MLTIFPFVLIIFKHIFKQIFVLSILEIKIFFIKLQNFLDRSLNVTALKWSLSKNHGIKYTTHAPYITFEGNFLIF